MGFIAKNKINSRIPGFPEKFPDYNNLIIKHDKILKKKFKKKEYLILIKKILYKI